MLGHLDGRGVRTLDHTEEGEQDTLVLLLNARQTVRLNRGRNLPWSREVGGTAQPGKGLLRRQWRDTWTDKRSVHGSRGTASQAPCCTWMRIGDKDSRDRDPGIGPFAAQLGNGEQTLVESRGHPPSTTHRETTRGGAGKRSGAWI